MTKQTRTFVLAASAIVVVGIGTAGVASYVGLGGLGVLNQQTDDELSFVPANAALIAYADVRHVMNSDLRHRLQAGLGIPAPGSDQLLEHTGINLETDIDSVIVVVLPNDAIPAVVDGGSPGESAGDMPLLLARGRFDRSRIEALVLGQGGSASDYNGTWLVTSESNDVGVAFIGTGLAAIGPAAAVTRLLENRATGGDSVRDDDALMRLVGRVDHASTWTVARFDALRNTSAVPAELVNQLPSISWFAASGQIDSGIAATIHAETRDAKAAQDLGEVIRGFVALARMQIGPQPAFSQVIDSMQLSTEGTTVTLGFSLPAEVIDSLTTMARPRSPAGASGRSAERPALTAPSI